MRQESYSVGSIDSSEYVQWLLYKHYAKRLPSISYSFGLFENAVLVGVCTFGQPASPNVNKGICGDKYADVVIELNRLVVNDGLVKNSLSYFVSRCIKMIPKPKIIVSYADSSLHYGFIYQALNFLYTGMGEPRTHIAGNNGKHPRHYVDDIENRIEWTPKHRYIYFIGDKRFKREALESLKYKVVPYPKGENKEYDSSFRPVVSQRLFND